DKLLNALAKDFIEHKFDIRHIERTILNSRTYQLSSSTNAGNRLDRTNYSHGFVRPLMAEVVIDTINSALGTTENFGKDLENARPIEVGPTRLTNPNVALALRVFGRPPRSSACDCERGVEPALPQTLFRMTDTFLLGKIKAPKGRLEGLLASDKADDEVL